jgi:Cof subfamily protein (haloacid dehalogenase superfamily)
MRRRHLALVAALVSLTACAAAPTIRVPAVYLDMDGTSLGADGRVRPATIRALERYRACGGRVGVATGRVLKQVTPHLGDLRPDLPIILYNGAVMMSSDGTRTLHEEKLDPEALRAALDAVRDLGGVEAVVLQRADATYVDRDATEYFTTKLYDWDLENDGVDADLYALSGGDAVKLLVFVVPGRADGVRATLTAAVGSKARAVISSAATVEVLGPGVNKARPIRIALEAAGIAPTDVLTVGDSGNDVEMLRDLGFGGAMGNCRPEACAAATARIGPHDTDAIADLLERAAMTPACP